MLEKLDEMGGRIYYSEVAGRLNPIRRDLREAFKGVWRIVRTGSLWQNMPND